MSPLNKPQPYSQVSLDDYLLQQSEPRFNDAIRRVDHEGEIYYSLVDLMREFADSEQEARKYWNDTKTRLKKEGFELSEIVGHLKLTAPDGKLRATDTATAQTCMRVLMSLPPLSNPEKQAQLEAVKQWMANVAGAIIDTNERHHRASLAREKGIGLVRKAGLDDTPDGRRLIARHENIEAYKALQGVIQQVAIAPDIAAITNSEYLAIFGETTARLREILQTKSIRDSLDTTQLRTLTFAEETLKDRIAGKRELTTQDIQAIINGVLPPIGRMLKELMDGMGLDHITGQPLLGD